MVNIAVFSSSYQKQLENNCLLDFQGLVTLNTAELSPQKTAEYNGMKFILYDSGYTLIQGSLHKYMNEGKHNYNDFSFNNLVEVITDLKNKFGLNLENCIFRNLEVGVNIIPPIKTNKVLDGLLIHHKQSFKDIALGYNRGNYKQAEHCRYYVKVYNKKMQYQDKYSIDTDILRFELKYVKMEDLKKLKIFSLLDLMDLNKLHLLSAVLLKTWDDILLYDKTINKNDLSRINKETKIHQWQNSRYWLGLNKQRRNEQKKNYNKVVQVNSQQIHKKMQKLIEDKIKFLLNKPLPINNILLKRQSLPSNSSYIELNGNKLYPIISTHY